MSKNLRSSIKGALNSSIKPGLLAPSQFRGSTLDLDFAGTKSLKNKVGSKDVVTFTRASSGTYVDGDGVIQSAAVDTPRFDHDPATGESLGLLLEEARTNLIDYSEDFNVSSPGTLQPYGSGSIQNAITAPDGTQTADFIAEDTQSAIHRGNRAFSVTTGSVYTVSCYLKAGTRTKANLQLTNPIFGYEEFDLVAGTSTGDNTTIENVGNGWYRCSMTSIPATATQSCKAQVELLNENGDRNYTGDGVSGLYVWGLQVEEGSYPTSYIPTSGTTVTRAADVAEITGANFSSFYNQSEGTVFAELGSEQGGVPARFQFSDDSGTNRLQSRKNQLYCFNGTQQFNLSYTSSLKEASAFSGTSTSVAVFGSVVATHGSASLPTCTNLELGKRSGTFDYLNGHIKRLAYFPVRLPDDTLQNITS